MYFAGILILLTILGVIFSLIISRSLPLLERVSIGFLLGTGIFTFLIFIFYLVGLRFTYLNLKTEWGALVLILSLVLYLMTGFKISNLRIWLLGRLHLKNISFKPKSWIHYIFGLMAFFTGLSFILGQYWPVYGWDSIAFYDFRGKTFFATGGLEDGIARGYFFGYPLYTSLMHMLSYFFQGNIHMFYLLLFLAFIVLTYYSLASFVPNKLAVLGTALIFFLPSTFGQSYFDYSNLPYSVFLICGILYGLRYDKEGKESMLIFSALFTGLSCWVRAVEPFWIINILLMTYIIIAKAYRYKNIYYLGWLVFVIMIVLILEQPWRLYESAHYHGLQNITDQAALGVRSIMGGVDVDRLQDVIATTWSETVSTWQPFLWIFMVAALINYKKTKNNILFLGLVISYIVLLFISTYLFSLVWSDWKSIIDSQQRLSSFMLPLLIFSIIVIAKDQLEKGLKYFEKN